MAAVIMCSNFGAQENEICAEWVSQDSFPRHLASKAQNSWTLRAGRALTKELFHYQPHFIDEEIKVWR